MEAVKYKLYLVHPITGLSYEEVVGYYNSMRQLLGMQYHLLLPMTGKGHLRTEVIFKAHGYGNPLSTNHAIKERDKWMVTQADVVYADFTGASRVSIGSVMELAWADRPDCHVVVAMEPDNVHQHAFVKEVADVIFSTPEEALAYLLKLPTGDM